MDYEEEDVEEVVAVPINLKIARAILGMFSLRGGEGDIMIWETEEGCIHATFFDTGEARVYCLGQAPQQREETLQ